MASSDGTLIINHKTHFEVTYPLFFAIVEFSRISLLPKTRMFTSHTVPTPHLPGLCGEQLSSRLPSL